MPTEVHKQGVRYIVVGVAATTIDFVITWLLLPHTPLLAANTTGFVVANIANFLLAHRWVFGRDFAGRQLVVTYGAVLLVSLVGLVVNDLVVWITLDLLKMPFLFGKVVATGICVFWNFAARRIWVYRDQPT